MVASRNKRRDVPNKLSQLLLPHYRRTTQAVAEVLDSLDHRLHEVEEGNE